LDHVALLAQVFDGLDEQQLDAVRALRQSLASMRNGSFFRCGVGHR